MADRELAYWTQKEKEDPSGVPWITDSVLPIVEAKRAQVVKSDFALNESIQAPPNNFRILAKCNRALSSPAGLLANS